MRIGTRKSKLAMIQTEMVAKAIQKHFPDMNIEIIGYETKGDRQMERSLADFGGKGAFTREIEQALMAGKIDLAVHSAKDMPLELPEGLTIGAVLARADSRDVWVSRRQERLVQCPAGSRVGTGSKRRALQTLEMNPGVAICDIRGNLPTRLKKLADGQYDGIILAAAGLERMGLISASGKGTASDKKEMASGGSFVLDGSRFYYEYLPEEQFLPAPGQGIIAVEAREGHCREVLIAIHDESAWLMLLAERAFLKTVGGGCNAAAAISVELTAAGMSVTARYAGDNERMATVVVSQALTEDRRENRRIAGVTGALAAQYLLQEKVLKGL